MRGRSLRMVFLVVGVVLAGVTWGVWIGLTAEEASKAAPSTALPADEYALPNIPRPIADALQNRRYDDAVKLIDEQLQKPSAVADYLTYLKGRALYLAQKYDEAIAVFLEGEKQFTESPWRHWLQFGRALALARKGDFASAEAIYRDQAKRLLSLSRKDELAGIYLEFANRLFDPPNKLEEKPDYGKARQFYEKARDLGPGESVLVGILFQIARCHQLSADWNAAIAAYRDFIQRFPQDSREIAARFHLGECLLNQGNLAEARRVWEDLLAKHQDHRSAETATAAFRLAETRGMPNPPSDEELGLGVAALRQFLERFPQDERVGQAYLIMAQGFVSREHWDDARRVLEEFLADARSEKAKERADAMFLLAEVYRQAKRFQEAIELWRKFVEQFPTHPSWNHAQAQIIETELAAAQEKFTQGDYTAARQAWETFLQLHPLDERAPKILYLFGEMNARQKLWDAAINDWRRLAEKYPDNPWGQQARFAIAQLYETQLHDAEKALEEYRKVGNPLSEAAAAAIARLTAKTLNVETPRVFRSDETPKVRLITRNIEKVSVAVYRLDPEAYFRKMHTLTGVEQLDVALIDPDTTFEFPIPDYRPYVELETFVPIPLPGGRKCGAAAVTISSATFEATTLLLQSNLDVIVKCSRDEVLVFSQNMITGQPWPGVRVLLAGPDGILHEAITGKDGVFQAALPALRQLENVQVLAIANDHLASNALSLAGLQPARGLTDRGFIYTDRPVYRAGQIVNVRGIVRFAQAKNEAASTDSLLSADKLVVPQDQAFTLRIVDPQDRILRQVDVTLDRFGCFHDQFLLPDEAEPGHYRIVLTDVANHTFQGGFRVEVFQLEPIQITVDIPRRVFYRGEKIEGTIRVAYVFGTPLAEKLVRYQLADQPVQTAMTDAQGEIHFSFETREYLETAMLPLVVSLPERNLAVTETFVLTTHGFTVDVTTPRRVYLPGETFEVSVTTRDASGQPIAQKLTLKVLKRTRVGRVLGEVLMEEQAMETDAEGRAKPVLHIDQGGEYILRIEGTDRFEHVVSAQTEVKVSDEKDADRLLILADQHTFRIGDESHLRVHWKDEPTLALVCFQGARIFHYRLVPLKKGDNEIVVPITSELAPQFELSVALMRDIRDIAPRQQPAMRPPMLNELSDLDWEMPDQISVPRRFFEAVAPFSVERDLKVSLQWKLAGDNKDGQNPTVVPPGAELEVVVTTTDAQGKPVPAQVSLALVEATLLQQFGEVPSIDEWLQGETRQAAVRTEASILFAYHPSTRPINPLLLAEEQRAELELAEAAARLALSEARREMEQPARNQLSLATGQFGYGGMAGAAPAPAQPPQSAAEKQQDEQDMAGRLAADGRERRSFKAQSGGKAEDKDKELLAKLTTNRLRDWGSRQDFLTPSVENLQRVGGITRQNFLVLDNKGRLQYFGQNQLAQADVRALAREFQKRGIVLYPEWTPHETAFWDPMVETNDSGKAVVKVVVPDRATSWKLLAKGVTVDTRVGESEAELQVKKGLFAEVRVPTAFHEGDHVDLPVTIHNDELEQGQIRLVSRVTIGTRTITESRSLEVTRKGLLTVSLPLKAELPEEVRQTIRSAETPEQLAQALQQNLELEVSLHVGDDRTPVDVVRYNVPLQPRGVMEFTSTSGSASSDTTAWLELPSSPDAPWMMEILIGPTIERSLSDIVLGSSQRFLPPCGEGSSLLDRTTSDLMAAVAVLNYFRSIPASADEIVQMVDTRIRIAVSTLVAAQRQDGGWSWSGAKRMRMGASDVDVASHPESSARAFWALHLARQAGYAVPQATYDNALEYLEKAMTQIRADDMEVRSVLIHALALAQRADFALVNRLHRERQNLSLAAKLYLALTLAVMQRQPMASEGLKLVDLSKAEEAAQTPLPRSVALSLTEAHALHALVLQAISPESPELRTDVEWLLSHRSGHRWLPDRATGLAALVLGPWFAKTRFIDEKYRLTVFVNDFQVGQWGFDQTSLSQSVLVPPKFFVGGRERIQFRLEGRGRFTYQCLARRFVNPEQARRGHYGSWLRPAPLEVDGREVPRGISSGNEGVFVKPGWSLPHSRVTQLPVGKQAIFEITAAPRVLTPGPVIDQFVLTVPIPAGTSVVPNTIVGPFDRYELRAQEIVFFFARPRSEAVTVNFRVTGTIPGDYVVEPAVIRNALDPTAYAVIPLSDAKDQTSASLKVLPEGVSSTDPYFLSPLELIALGKSAYAKKDWKSAEKYFAELFTNPNWQVMDETVKALAPLLVDIYLELDQPDKVVHYFEILKVKWPDYEIPFDKILRIAACYERLGEYERSFLIFRAILESSFVNDSYTAGFLDEQNEFVRSVQLMNRLLAEYPPEPYAAAARYALAQRVYAKANEATADMALRKAKITRVHLISAAWEMLDRFLTAFPEDPAADQAAFAAAHALLDCEFYSQAAEAAGRYAQRYAESSLLDSFWYLIGYCHYADGRHEQAIEMCRKVADWQRKDPATGRTEESKNKWQALYILGQIYHSLGQPLQAINYYQLVSDRFSDAKEAIDYFKRKAVALPEVTFIKPGEPVTLTLRSRNITQCELKAYRIDLLKFTLLKRDFSGIVGINLAGIRPEYEETIQLGEAQDFRDHEHQVKLPFDKDGAYLIVCRGDDLYASGLALISPLRMEVQEDAVSGRVRVTIKNVDGNFVNNVHVKVVGSRNAEFVAGRTDLRGVFVADGIQGRVTVIAQKDSNQYAFYRGETDLLPAPARPGAPPAPSERKPQAAGEDRRELLRGLEESNRMLQQQQIENLRQNYQQQRKGVEASKAF